MDTLNKYIIEAIDEIEYCKYDLIRSKRKNRNDGTTENIYWQDELILKAISPPLSHCVGAVCEVILKALKKAGLEPVIPVEDIKKFCNKTFIMDLEEDYKGIQDAITSMGWGQVVTELEDYREGDLAQIWHEDGNGKYKQGHSVVILGVFPEHNRVKDWSASTTGKTGHLVTERKYEVTDGEYDRQWYVGRIHINMIKSKYENESE